jgi:hypothetical protein
MNKQIFGMEWGVRDLRPRFEISLYVECKVRQTDKRRTFMVSEKAGGM